MRTTIGSTTTHRGTPASLVVPTDQTALVHNLGAGIMASITALSKLLELPAIDVAGLDDDGLLEALRPYRTILFQGWNPRFAAVAARLDRDRRLFAHWHTGISGVEAMGEGEILADALASDRLEALLWTHPEFSELEHPRIVSFPNVAVRGQFQWIVDAPRADLPADRFRVLLPTINRPVKNGLTAAFATALVHGPVPLELHVTHAFGNGHRCGLLLRQLFADRLVVHPSLPVRAPRWGSIMKSVDLALHLSFSESYCYALIESLVGGVPVIVSRGVPMATYIACEHDLDWTVVEPYAVAPIAQAIERVARMSPEARAELATRQLEAFRRYNRACAAALMLRCAELALVDGRVAARGLAELV